MTKQLDTPTPEAVSRLARSHLAKVALAAWVGVTPDQLPAEKMWIEHPCDLNRQAWERVIAAVLEAARSADQDRIRELEGWVEHLQQTIIGQYDEREAARQALATIRDMKAFGADADALDDLVRDIRAKAAAALQSVATQDRGTSREGQP